MPFCRACTDMAAHLVQNVPGLTIVDEAVPANNKSKQQRIYSRKEDSVSSFITLPLFICNADDKYSLQSMNLSWGRLILQG